MCLSWPRCAAAARQPAVRGTVKSAIAATMTFNRQRDQENHALRWIECEKNLSAGILSRPTQLLKFSADNVNEVVP